MTATSESKSSQIRATLDYPVIDTDGHLIEFLPLFLDYLKEVGGAEMAGRFEKESVGDNLNRPTAWHRMSKEERRDQRAWRPVWWIKPTLNTLDRATAMLPRLLRERMDEMGLDFSVLYPTMGLVFLREDQEDLRRAGCRALNRMHADLYREHAQRMTPVAAVPAYTPQEAIEEAEYAVNELGLKAIMISGNVRRPVPAVLREAPRLAHHALWLDHLALDSDHDYDPLWAKCMELKVAVTSHGNLHGMAPRTSLSSYVYNHIGKFASAGDAFCKALFLGGVTRRFPELHFAFLEGGVAWACSLFSDLIGHWEKRNLEALDKINPASLDLDMLEELFQRYGGPIIEGRQDSLRGCLESYREDHEDPASIDEWAACEIARKEDIHGLFARNFYFGCEADDPTNAWAFKGPPEMRLKAMFGSDIGHWDVPDMSGVLQEAYELVEHGHIDEAAFKQFVFANPAMLHAGMNPDFFKGTLAEDAVAGLLAEA
ncbi:MAG: amidohydrolase family protein [SAR324 cluster bacterium]|nr:amidohydrolase family protein [SAR324 cluster bacterium]